MTPRFNSSSLRVFFFYAILIVAVAVLIGRLFILQVAQSQVYAEQAYENRVTRLSDPAPRGIIYDRWGTPLVRNVPSFDIVITPAQLPDNEAQVEAIYRRLAGILKLPITVPGSTPQAPCRPGRGIRDLADEGAGFAPYIPVKIKCDVDKVTALTIREQAADLPGVGVIVEPLRDYPTGALTASIIGYLAPIPPPNEAPLTYKYFTDLGFIPGRDRIGVAGIEASMQDILGGQNGSKLMEEDVAGQPLHVLGIEKQTVAGLNVQLSLDIRLQSAAQAALTHRLNFINSYLGRIQSSAGVVIVMNPQNGQILAMVSWPTYDNNRFARNIDYEYYSQLAGDPVLETPPDPFLPLLNHAVGDLYPPGSVFKIVTATGVMEEKVIDPRRQIFDPGKITISNRYFPADPGKARDFVCWDRAGHGKVDFIRGIAESCDVYFYKVGGGWAPDKIDGLGIDRLEKWMQLFGFGEKTGVELPDEVAGFVPSKDWKRITYGESWSTGDTYNAVIGQGYVLSTPLQMLNAINVVINGGKLYQPTLIDKILDGEGNVISQTQPVLIREVPIAAENLRLIRTGMREAVLGGTLSGPIAVFAGEVDTPIVDVPSVNVAGKTGTAEYCDKIAYPKGLCVPGQWPTHAWTALYAPYENPEVSVIVMVYNGGEGSKTAAPIASTVLRSYFELKAVGATNAADAPDAPR